MNTRSLGLIWCLSGCGRSGFGLQQDAPPVVFATSSLVVPIDTTRASADQLCGDLAGTAGLPGSFTAWLGKDTAATRPLVGSGGWVRVDGLAVALTLADLAGGRILRPVAFDERGVDVRGDGSNVLTASLPDGSLGSPARDCANFTSATELVTVGSTAATTDRMIKSVNVSCTEPARLFCFELRASGDLAAPSEPGRLAFVSTGTYMPGGGLVAADLLCQQEAEAAGRPETFRALLATTTEPAASRLGSTRDPWVRPDGIVLGSDADFRAGQLAAPVNVTADGSYVSGDAWIGATTLLAPGTTSSTCDNWQSTSGATGKSVGPVSHSLSGLAGVRTGSCDEGLRVYCIETR